MNGNNPLIPQPMPMQGASAPQGVQPAPQQTNFGWPTAFGAGRGAPPSNGYGFRYNTPTQVNGSWHMGNMATAQGFTPWWASMAGQPMGGGAMWNALVSSHPAFQSFLSRRFPGVNFQSLFQNFRGPR